MTVMILKLNKRNAKALTRAGYRWNSGHEVDLWGQPYYPDKLRICADSKHKDCVHITDEAITHKAVKNPEGTDSFTKYVFKEVL